MCLAVPGKVIEVRGDEPILRTAIVDFGGIRKEVNLACVPEAGVGEYVLVHVGFAITTLDEAEAGRAFEYLRSIDELRQLEETPA